ncbi:MAG: hypothetical protein AB7P49_18300 [Bdellovibrionales bacterium]
MGKKGKKKDQEILGVLGVGLDGTDEEKRITRNEDILLVGGSQETHERMQDISIRFNESLKARGKTLHEAEAKEVLDLIQKAMDQ